MCGVWSWRVGRAGIGPARRGSRVSPLFFVGVVGVLFLCVGVEKRPAGLHVYVQVTLVQAAAVAAGACRCGSCVCVPAASSAARASKGGSVLVLRGTFKIYIQQCQPPTSAYSYSYSALRAAVTSHVLPTLRNVLQTHPRPPPSPIRRSCKIPSRARALP